MATINLPPVNTTAFVNRPAATAGATATANLQTGFTAQNTFAAGQANFAALGAPDQAGSSLQALTQVVQALGEIVKALGALVTALKGGGAENAQAKQPEAGAGGAEPQTSTNAKEDKGAEAAKEAGGGGGAEAAKDAGGGGGAEAAKGAGGGGAMESLGSLTQLLQSLMAIIQSLQEQEDGKADGKKGHKKDGKHGAEHASAKGKEHANEKSAVGQAAQMEKLNQAVMQILTSLMQLLGPLLQQLAGQMQDNPAAAQAGQQVQTALASIGGGGARGGVVM